MRGQSNVLTESQVRVGGEVLQEADASNIPISAAIWCMTEEGDAWKLLLADVGVEETGPLAAYEKLQHILGTLGEPDEIRLSDIRVIRPHDPLVEGLRQMFGASSRSVGKWIGGIVCDSTYIPDAYIYRLS